MDRIAEMLSSLKNASMARRKEIEVMYTTQCEAIAKVLKSRGFLDEVKTFKLKDKPFKRLSLTLSYDGDQPRLTETARVSKLGRRMYKGYDELHKVLGGLGVSVVSTSRGIMAGDEARKKKLGGEIICQVS